MAAPKHIFIDWYGTLSTSHYWHTWRPHKPNLLDDLKATFAADTQQLMVPWMRGQLTAEQFTDAMARSLDQDADELMAALEHSCRRLKFINPAVLTAIKALREKGYKVYIATDNMDVFRRWTVPAMALDDHFDGLLVSNELGVLKGDTDSLGKSLFFDGQLGNENILIDDSDYSDIMNKTGITQIKIEHGQDIVPILQKLARD